MQKCLFQNNVYYCIIMIDESLHLVKVGVILIYLCMF